MECVQSNHQSLHTVLTRKAKVLRRSKKTSKVKVLRVLIAIIIGLCSFFFFGQRVAYADRVEPVEILVDTEPEVEVETESEFVTESVIDSEEITMTKMDINESDEIHQNIIRFEEAGLAFILETEAIIQDTNSHYELISEKSIVNIMLDDLRGSDHLAYNTSVYSGRYMESSTYTKSYDYEELDFEGMPAHIYTFERMPLVYGPELMSNFAYIEIELDERILLSVHVKSNEAIDVEQYLNRFVRIETDVDTKSELAIMELKVSELDVEIMTGDQFENDPVSFEHEKTTEAYNEIFESSEDSDEVTWGIFDPSTHYELTYVEEIENNTGISLDIILEYYDLDYLPRVEKMREISESGRILELTYQTSKYGVFNADALYEVLDGKHDNMIDELIIRIKELDEPVLFRPNNEMNGDWCGYNAMYTHKETEVYKTFWRWLYERFEEADCDNVIWVWNPNWGDFPNAEWNHYLQYFPGEEYVDVVGLTGYNTGTYYEAEQWKSFAEIYMPMLWEYKKHFTDYPYMITEFGSSAIGGDKGQWIESVFKQIEKLDIKAAVWWNHVDYDTKKGVVSRGYKFNNDPNIMNIFRENFKDKQMK